MSSDYTHPLPGTPRRDWAGPGGLGSHRPYEQLFPPGDLDQWQKSDNPKVQDWIKGAAPQLRERPEPADVPSSGLDDETVPRGNGPFSYLGERYYSQLNDEIDAYESDAWANHALALPVMDRRRLTGSIWDGRDAKPSSWKPRSRCAHPTWKSAKREFSVSHRPRFRECYDSHARPLLAGKQGDGHILPSAGKEYISRPLAPPEHEERELDFRDRRSYGGIAVGDTERMAKAASEIASAPLPKGRGSVIVFADIRAARRHYLEPGYRPAANGGPLLEAPKPTCRLGLVYPPCCPKKLLDKVIKHAQADKDVVDAFDEAIHCLWAATRRAQVVMTVTVKGAMHACSCGCTMRRASITERWAIRPNGDVFLRRRPRPHRGARWEEGAAVYHVYDEPAVAGPMTVPTGRGIFGQTPLTDVRYGRSRGKAGVDKGVLKPDFPDGFPYEEKDGRRHWPLSICIFADEDAAWARFSAAWQHSGLKLTGSVYWTMTTDPTVTRAAIARSLDVTKKEVRRGLEQAPPRLAEGLAEAPEMPTSPPGEYVFRPIGTVIRVVEIDGRFAKMQFWDDKKLCWRWRVVKMPEKVTVPVATLLTRVMVRRYREPQAQNKQPPQGKLEWTASHTVGRWRPKPSP
jgi:hypothetical protein